jgi:hypothetical protein
MISLKRNENIQVFQIALSLKEKIKQSPFIAILMLAQEQGRVSPNTLRRYLLPALPERACENLLFRLMYQGYLLNGDEDEYTLTQFGINCATDKTFWIGEKGIYNVFVSKSNLVKQRIIKIDKIERTENDRDVLTSQTPSEVKNYENQIILINNTEKFIEKIEDKCFQLNPIKCTLEINSNAEETILKISNSSNQSLYNTILDFTETGIQEEILTNAYKNKMPISNPIILRRNLSSRVINLGKSEYYDNEKKAIIVPFEKNNISFVRSVQIQKPIFQNNEFDSVELKNISYLPCDNFNAQLWYGELLKTQIDNYFFDDSSFSAFANIVSEPFQKYFKINIPDRKYFVEQLKKRNDSFYEISKLESADYLSY